MDLWGINKTNCFRLVRKAPRFAAHLPSSEENSKVDGTLYYLCSPRHLVDRYKILLQKQQSHFLFGPLFH
jgi:hypothetical protein